MEVESLVVVGCFHSVLRMCYGRFFCFCGDWCVS